MRKVFLIKISLVNFQGQAIANVELMTVAQKMYLLMESLMI